MLYMTPTGAEKVTENTEKFPKWKIVNVEIFLFALYMSGIPLNYSLNCSYQSIDCGEISPEPKQYKDKTFQKLQGW